ncbi:MAG: ABC transporter substrate-binding protein, partial [Candidatus Dormibacteria bacterium]
IYLLDEGMLGDLHPELVITQELCEVCAVSYAEVDRAVRKLPGDVPVLSLEPGSLADICRTILAVGEATRHDAGARAVVASMQARIDAVDALPPVASATSRRLAPRVACLEWTDPIMAGGHWVPEMVRRAGGIDVLGKEGTLSSYVEWQRVIGCDPDVMVLMPCGFNLEQTMDLATDISGRPGFRDLSCARSGCVVAVDGSAYFNRPGPRIVDGLELLAAILRAAPGDHLPDGAGWVTN